jgi:hypothetical protein
VSVGGCLVICSPSSLSEAAAIHKFRVEVRGEKKINEIEKKCSRKTSDKRIKNITGKV